jgi:hypothetical protein
MATFPGVPDPLVVGPDDVLVVNLGPYADRKMISNAIGAIKAQRPDLIDAGRILVCAVQDMAVIRTAREVKALQDATAAGGD